MPVESLLPPSAARRVLPWVALGAVLAGATAAYAPALDGQFVFDDEQGILQNARIRDCATYLKASTAQSLLSGRPLTEITFALDHMRAGLDPSTFHESNLLLHLASAVLVFFFTRHVARRAQMENATGLALAVTALFAVHPIQAEAVAYVSQRAEELASLLALASLLLLLHGDRAPRRAARIVLGLAAVVLYGLAIAAKQSVVAVPGLFLLAAAAVPEEQDGARAQPQSPTRRTWTWRAAVVAPMVALAGIQAVFFFEAIEGSGVGFSVRNLDPWRYLLTQARVVPLYLRLVVWPVGLNADHDISPSEGLFTPWTTLAGGLFVLALIGASIVGFVWTHRRGRTSRAAPSVRVASFGVAWFFLVLAPTSTIVPVADVAVEHRVYLATWGILAAVAALAGEAARVLPTSVRRTALTGAGIAATVALAVSLHTRAGVWSSALELWTDAAAKSPRKARVHLNLGHARHARGDLRGALDAYESALALDDRGLAVPLVIHNRSSALAGLGRFAEARAVLLEQQPPDPETLVLRVHIDLSEGRIAEAAETAAIVARFAPGYPRAHQAAAKVALAEGDLSAARAAFLRSLMLFPADPSVLADLGRVEERLGDLGAACRAWRSATRTPGNAWASRWAASEMVRARCP
jgi:tetratricopeptide (TPR) repeat protein